MQRHDVINTLSGGRFVDYLEIGVDYGTTFNQVVIPNKIGVDPGFKVSLETIQGTAVPLTSDDYFASSDQKFDCIFIDGLHTYEQSRRDFENAWHRLKPGGVVVIDDCYPKDALAALPDVEACLNGRRELGTPEDMTWMGDVYKTVIWINDFTSYSFSYVKEIEGVVVVWQKPSRAEKWIGNEDDIANCSYEAFLKLPIPSASIKTIMKQTSSNDSLWSRLFG